MAFAMPGVKGHHVAMSAIFYVIALAIFEPPKTLSFNHMLMNIIIKLSIIIWLACNCMCIILSRVFNICA